MYSLTIALQAHTCIFFLFSNKKKSNSKPIPQTKSSEIYAKHYQKRLFFLDLLHLFLLDL